MSSDKINQLVNSIAKIVENSEKVAIPMLTTKLNKVAKVHPHDQTIIAMSNVLNKMDDNNKLFISRDELKKLYSKLYTRNNKFAEYFENELGSSTELATPTIAEVNSAPMSGTYDLVDPILSNALDAAFDNNIKIKSYSEVVAGSAKVAVASNLDVWNLKATKLEVEAGNQNFIIVKASYNTPKGTTGVFVPVETVKGKVLEPSLFMCNAGPQELNHVNLKNYISSFAGAKLKVRAEDILTVLTNQISGGPVLSAVELAATKIAASKEHGAFGGIMGQVVDEESKNLQVSMPKFAESELFEKKFSTASGIAGFTFGSDKINIGRDAIVRKLSVFGIKNSQINVIGTDESTIFLWYNSFGGKTAFKVPVKVSNDKVSSPEMIMCNGSISSFTKESISELLVGGVSDAKVAAATSPQHDLNPAELVYNVKVAVADGNYVKAEDALNILKQSGNDGAYRDAFVSYINGMGLKKVALEKQTVCSLIVKSANSKHPICGHTNLPTHKVYQDSHGNCHPLYRQGMDETYEGAFFMNAKILG